MLRSKLCGAEGYQGGGVQKTERKVKARDELVRFAEKETEQKFHNLSGIQQSHELTRFYIKEIYNRTRTEISDEDLALALVDGAQDLGCDLIHRDDNHVVIVQSKYRGANAREKPEEVSHFQSVLIRLRDPGLQANDLILDQISTIDWANDRFSLIFITMGGLKNQAADLAELPPQYPAGFQDLQMRCEWHFMDEERLNEEYRSAISYEKGPSGKVVTLFPVGEKGSRGASSVVSVQAGPYRSYMMALDANQIVNAYHQLDREQLFSLNIRNFIGNTVTNRRIIDTATTKSESFFLFNNGISCLCSYIDPKPDKILVTGLQVINGAQTVKALVNAARAQKGKPASWADAPPTVLVRVTEIPGGYGQSGAMRDQITQFNNTQNVIKVSDFRSNDSVQKHLKEQFAAVRHNGKAIEYQAKRTDRITRGTEVIRLEEFAKTIYAFLEEPTSFDGATAFLFDEQNGGYSSIFGDGKTVWEKMPDDEFKLRTGIYWIAQAFAARLRADRSAESDADVRAALERKWLVIYASRKVFEHYFPKETWRLEIAKAYRGDWVLGEGNRGKALLRIYQDAKAGLILAYRNAKSGRSGFVHRNWMRSKDTPGEVASILKDVILPVREPLTIEG